MMFKRTAKILLENQVSPEKKNLRNVFRILLDSILHINIYYINT